MTDYQESVDPFSLAAERRFNKRADVWRDDPQRWAGERLGVHLWSLQAEILLAIPKYKKVAVRACHSAGKSFGASTATGWWLDTHPPKETRVVTTAPTHTQVKAVLWNEINSMFERSVPDGQQPLPGRVNQTEWWIGNYLAAVGRKPSDYRPETFQGLHARWLLGVLDEADGLPAAIFNAMETLATNANACILAIGNPDDPQSEVRRNQDDQIVNGKKGTYKTFKIDAWSTPNFTGEVVPLVVAESLLTPPWVEDKKIRWGEDSPLYVSKVTAEYPLESAFTVIRIRDLKAARFPAEPTDEARIGRRQVGIDLSASENGDESVIRLRVGTQLQGIWRKRSKDPEELAEWIGQVITETDATIVAFDVNGVGFGFEALIKQQAPGCVVLPVNAGRGSHQSNKYVNLRAEMWWKARLALQNGQWDLSHAPESDDLAAELLAPRWEQVKGRILVESKDEIRKRLGRSTDDADATLLAYYDSPAGGTATVHSTAAHQLPRGAAIAGRRR